MISARLTYGVVRFLGIAGCVMLFAAGNAQAQLPRLGLAAEIVAVGPTAGGIFPGGFLAEFTANGDFFDVNGTAEIAVDVRCPQRNLTEYTGLTAANVDGSRAVFVTTRPGFGRVCKVVCWFHGLHPDGVGDPGEPSGPPLFNPDPTTGEPSMIYMWNFVRISRGSPLFNFGAPKTYMIIDDPLPGNPLIPNLKENDKLKLVFVGGDNVITKTYVHPNFFWEKGIAPIQEIGTPENSAKF